MLFNEELQKEYEEVLKADGDKNRVVVYFWPGGFWCTYPELERGIAYYGKDYVICTVSEDETKEEIDSLVKELLFAAELTS